MQLIMPYPARRSSLLMITSVAIVTAVLPVRSFCQQPPAPAKAAAAPTKAADDDDGDLARKAEIMNSQRWRRAIFELGEWLSSQQIYSPQEVHNIKAGRGDVVV